MRFINKLLPYISGCPTYDLTCNSSIQKTTTKAYTRLFVKTFGHRYLNTLIFVEVNRFFIWMNFFVNVGFYLDLIIQYDINGVICVAIELILEHCNRIDIGSESIT